MADSTVPAAKAWLVSHITTAVNNNDVLTIQGLPDTFEPDDIILISRIERQPTRSSFGGHEEESYTIYLEVSCFAGGEPSQTASDRFEVLAALIEGVVRADPTMGGLLLDAEPSRSSSQPDFSEGDEENAIAAGHLYTGELGIACLADL